MGISVWTVRKWRRKYQRDGRSGLGSRMGPRARWDSFRWNFVMMNRTEKPSRAA
jgi:transposase-like protein